MPIFGPEQVEAEARALLRERIERTPWFQHGTTPEQRQAAIDHELDRWWHLMIDEAVRRLVERYLLYG